jgi:hypothetical protein
MQTLNTNYAYLCKSKIIPVIKHHAMKAYEGVEV